MKAILKKCRSKLKSRRGFSLGELLITVLILLLVTVIVAEGVPTALRAYDRIVTAANAQALLSTAMTKLRNELSTASNVKVGTDQTTISFISGDGLQVTLYLVTSDPTKEEALGINIKETYGVTSTVDTDPKPQQRTRPLISTAASNKNLYVKYGSCSKSDDGIITFNDLFVYSVKDTAGTNPLAKIDKTSTNSSDNCFKIRLLSGA